MATISDEEITVEPRVTSAPFKPEPEQSQLDLEHRTCRHTIEGTRNLIVCIDGTQNKFGKKNTNVIELYNLILKGHHDNQHTWYNSGIGTYARPAWKLSPRHIGRALYHWVDSWIAWDFEKTVLAAYRWLSDNYQHGDCIFLFGFSRGAFQVRALSAMIDRVGLILKGNEKQIPFAYELYVDEKSGSTQAPQVGSISPKEISMAERFKEVFSYRNVQVHFVGAWDSVSSIGFLRGKDMLPGTIDGMKHVCYFRHALALDERRIKFIPEFAYGREEKEVVETDETTSKAQHTKEVWFAGTHSDIGGGNVDNSGLDRSRPPLRWMVREARDLGLHTKEFPRTLSSTEQIQIKESLKKFWWMLEISRFHFGSGREIHKGQKIHSSLILADSRFDNYIPKARPIGSNKVESASFWEEVLRKGMHSTQLELDHVELAEAAFQSFLSEKEDGALRRIAKWRDGQQAVYERVVEQLQNTSSWKNPEDKVRFLRRAIDILKGGQHLKRKCSTDIHPLLSDLWDSGIKRYQIAVRDFVQGLTNPHIALVHKGQDKGNPVCVVYSPNGENIAFSSGEKIPPSLQATTNIAFSHIIRILDTKSNNQVGKPLTGHTSYIRSIAYSPKGEYLASVSDDRSVRIWDTTTQEQVKKLETGSSILSVAYSPNKSTLSYGLKNGEVWNWNPNQTDPIQKNQLHGLRGGGRILSVAYSPNGDHLAVGSDDGAIRSMDLKQKKVTSRLLQGRSSCVRSIAFIPNAGDMRVVSGSSDNEVLSWNAEMGDERRNPGMRFRAFREKFSASLERPHSEPDKPLWIGNLETNDSTTHQFALNMKGLIRLFRVIDVWEKKKYLWRGPEFSVFSVACSSDGRRVAFGMDDFTIQVWDVKKSAQVGETLRGHEHIVCSIAYSPDNKRLVSGSYDGTVRIWDVKVYGL